MHSEAEADRPETVGPVPWSSCRNTFQCQYMVNWNRFDTLTVESTTFTSSFKLLHLLKCHLSGRYKSTECLHCPSACFVCRLTSSSVTRWVSSTHFPSRTSSAALPLCHTLPLATLFAFLWRCSCLDPSSMRIHHDLLHHVMCVFDTSS